MSSSIIEQIRDNLQDYETIEKAIANQILYKSENVQFSLLPHNYLLQPKESVLTDHKIKNLTEIAQQKCANALSMIQDSDG